MEGEYWMVTSFRVTEGYINPRVWQKQLTIAAEPEEFEPCRSQKVGSELLGFLINSDRLGFYADSGTEWALTPSNPSRSSPLPWSGLVRCSTNSVRPSIWDQTRGGSGRRRSIPGKRAIGSTNEGMRGRLGGILRGNPTTESQGAIPWKHPRSLRRSISLARSVP